MRHTHETARRLRLQGRTIRIGRTPQSGPRFVLVRYDKRREHYLSRNVHNGVEDYITSDDLSRGFEDQIVHLERGS